MATSPDGAAERARASKTLEADFGSPLRTAGHKGVTGPVLWILRGLLWSLRVRAGSPQRRLSRFAGS